MTIRATPTRIVLVEDDPSVARSTRRVLSCVRNVIVETCHVHVPRILGALRHQPVMLPDGAVDD
jgi:hypothetical protein